MTISVPGNIFEQNPLNIMLDDLRALPVSGITFRNSQDCIDFLGDFTAGAYTPMSEKFVLWLDWDLGGDDTSRKLLDFLAEEFYHPRGENREISLLAIHVVTSNPRGREEIKSFCDRWLIPRTTGEIVKDEDGNLAYRVVNSRAFG